MHSPNLGQENLQKLMALFPSCVTETRDAEGKVKRVVDLDQLRQEFGDSLVEGPIERYQLNWPGKREALLAANSPIAKTLRPCREESVDFDTTRNLFIEGDNLDALKLLQDNYLGKIKVIYIDPPYNTGNDFLYEDDFAESTSEYLIRSNQIDDTGNKLVVNTESNGRFHSDWLSFIYPRLKLARNLLTDDGVIFISINDVENKNLLKLCDEVFGEDNFLANLVWANQEGGGGSDSKFFRLKHEYIVCYAKDITQAAINGVEISNEDRYSMSDEHEATRGKFYLQKLGMGSIQYSESLDYPIKAPDGTDIYPSSDESRACWRWSKDKVEWGFKNDFIVIKRDKAEIWQVYTKQYLKCDNEGKPIERTNRPMGVINKFSGVQAGKYIQELMGARIFSYPKPVELISYLLSLIPIGEKDYILDFFAGSSTTADAAMRLNNEDGGNRQFIMVQLPEPIDDKSAAYKAGYLNIAEISKARISRVGQRLREASNASENIKTPDVGFRVLKIDTSNFKDIYYNPDSLEQTQLTFMTDNIKPGRTEEDLLFQVLLDWGVELGKAIEQQAIDDKTVYFVDGNDLVACFDGNDGINEDFVKKLAAHKPLRVVFRDAGFKSDSEKINVEQIFKLMSPVTDVKVL